jgi:hypothetical protein
VSSVEEQEAAMVDRTAEIATLRQKLAALAQADRHNVFIQESGRHNATEADKDNAFKRLTSWTSDNIKSTPRPHDRRERMAALLRDMSNPVEG